MSVVVRVNHELLYIGKTSFLMPVASLVFHNDPAGFMLGLLRSFYKIYWSNGYLLCSNILILYSFKNLEINENLSLASFCQHMLSGLHFEARPK